MSIKLVLLSSKVGVECKGIPAGIVPRAGTQVNHSGGKKARGTNDLNQQFFDSAIAAVQCATSSGHIGPAGFSRAS